eukprot:1140828-Pelagomonas_calceolata.AAC.4
MSYRAACMPMAVLMPCIPSRSPFHRTISSRPSEKEQPPSILSALDQGMNRNTARTPRYAGQEGETTRTMRLAMLKVVPMQHSCV